MKSLKKLLAKYSLWITHVLAMFGPWGVFIAATADSILPVLPIDAVVAGYVYREPHKILLYAALASAGSAIGSLVPFYIGRAGGELLLLRHIDRARMEAMQKKYEAQEFFFVAVPMLLPPPAPVKLFVLGAGAFEMRVTLFMASVFAGRMVRFLALGFMVMKFGPEIVDLFLHGAMRHTRVSLAVLAAIALFVAVWMLLRRRRRRSTRG